MEQIQILTKILRKELINKYYDLKLLEKTSCTLKYYDLKDQFDYYNQDFDDYYDYNYEDFDDKLFEENGLMFEENVLLNLLKDIKESKYKNIFFLILFEDVYEYIKSKEIIDSNLYEYELNILKDLENIDLAKLINNIENDNEFALDIFTLFIEYDSQCLEEDRIKNKKLIELSNNIEYLDKFKIHILDTLQYQLNKRRN